MRRLIRLDGGTGVLAGTVVRSEPGKGRARDMMVWLVLDSDGEETPIACWGENKAKAESLNAGTSVFVKTKTDPSGALSALALKRQGVYKGQISGEPVDILVGTAARVSEIAPDTAQIVVPTSVSRNGKWETKWNKARFTRDASDAIFGALLTGDRVAIVGHETDDGEYAAQDCVYLPPA